MLSALALAALVAGLAGTWSPCGFSMIETLGRTGHRGGLPATIALSATLAAGALAGGAATFTALAGLGALAHGSGGGTVAGAAAAAIAVVAALAEARGARVIPQVRRQVPEPWRRTLPLPLAGAGYGVLLGLGFTTFVLSYGVWALFAIAFVLGNVPAGLAVGLAFGLGRALPVLALAPLAGTEAGARATETMAERPPVLRGLRLAEALALAGCAVLIGTTDASASAIAARGAADPSLDGRALAWRDPAGAAFLRDGGRTTPLAGAHPALGGGLLAIGAAGEARVSELATGRLLRTLAVPGADALAVSRRWLAYRAHGAGGGDELVAVALDGSGPRRVVARARPPAQLGRPSLAGSRVAFHVAGTRVSRIVTARLPAGRTRTLRRSRRVGLLNPSLRGGRLLYVRVTARAQELRLSRPGRERVLLRLRPTARVDADHEPGRRLHTRRGRPPRRGHEMLWTTALGARTAYVTRLDLRRPSAPVLLRVGL